MIHFTRQPGACETVVVVRSVFVVDQCHVVEFFVNLKDCQLGSQGMGEAVRVSDTVHAAVPDYVSVVGYRFDVQRVEDSWASEFGWERK